MRPHNIPEAGRAAYYKFYYALYFLSLVAMGFSVSIFAVVHFFVFLAFALVFKKMTEKYSVQ